jgi:hypothetical protein
MPVLFDSLLGLALYIIIAVMTSDKGLALKAVAELMVSLSICEYL